MNLRKSHGDRGAAERGPWCIEFQNLPVTRCIIFFHPTEAKEAQVREHLRKVESLKETCVDYEGTIQQFRELVLLAMLVLSFVTSSEPDQLHTDTQTVSSESASVA